MAFDFLKRFKRKQAQKASSDLLAKTKEHTEPKQSAVDLPKEKKMGSSMVASRVLVAPHISEKASLLQTTGTYVFKVSPDANKVLIKQAIEDRYGVHVKTVHVAIMPGKKRQRGKVEGYKSGFKKAMVTIQEGETIDVF